MAEPKQNQQKAEVKAPAPAKKGRPEEEEHEVLIRIFGYDMPGSKNIHVGLTRIKGISWGISNAVCTALKLSKNKKVSELSREEITKIEKYLADVKVPDFMKNRRFDPESGTTTHIFGSDLDIAREFDIKREKKMKSYRGFRHAYNQPVRGQRTKSHFRKKGQGAGGIKKKKEATATAKK